MNIGIIWADPHSTNLGVSALAYSSLAIIYDIAQDSNKAVSITFIGTGRWNTDVIKLGNKNIVIENIGTINIFKDFRTIFKYKLLGRLLKLNIIFDIAAGDSFSDIYGVSRFKRMLYSKKLFQLLGKKQILLPQTIGPFSTKNLEKKAFNVMSGLSMVMCRDKQSFDYCAKFLQNKNLYECIDLAFYLPFKALHFDNSLIQVGINLSGLLWNGGYSRDNQFNLKIDYQSLMRRIIELFYKRKNVQIHLIGHVIHFKNGDIEDDYAICELLKREFPNVVLAPKFKNPIDAKNYISGMDFFTGARMHSCIAAFSSGIACYPLAYSRKFSGLFKYTLNYKWMADCTIEDEEEILFGIKDAFENRVRLKSITENINNSVVRERITIVKKLLKESIS